MSGPMGLYIYCLAPAMLIQKTILFIGFLFAANTNAIAADDPCKEGEKGSYRSYAECGQNKFEKSESELNKVYKNLISALQDDPERKTLTIKSQRAWLLYRKGSCEFWSGLLTYHMPWCLITITDQRTAELTHMYLCLTEGGNEC